MEELELELMSNPDGSATLMWYPDIIHFFKVRNNTPNPPKELTESLLKLAEAAWKDAH